MNDTALQVARELTLRGEKVCFLAGSEMQEAAVKKANFAVTRMREESLDLLAIDLGTVRSFLVLDTSDSRNLRVSQAAVDLRISHVIVLVNDPVHLPKFRDLDIQTFTPALFQPTLLALMASNPDRFTLLSSTREDQQARLIVLGNPELAGQRLQDLQLGADLLVLSIRRGGDRLIPHGKTRLEIGDEITILGCRKTRRMKKFSTEVHLSREMGLWDAALIGVGAMIGAGIFVLTGIAAGVAGPGLIITFSLNGLVALLTAFSYAELGSCFHDAGGGYLWVKEGLPKWNGFISGWMSWFAHAVACSLYALGFGAYFDLVLREFHVVMPHWGFFSPQKILAVVAAIAFAYVNFRGASETGKVGNFVTIAKIVILMIFVGFGLGDHFPQARLAGRLHPFSSQRLGRRLQSHGADLHRLPGVRGHLPMLGGDQEPEEKHSPGHFPFAGDRRAHLSSRGLHGARHGPGRGHDPLGLSGFPQGDGPGRGGQEIFRGRRHHAPCRRHHLDHVGPERHDLFLVPRGLRHGKGQEFPGLFRQGPQEKFYAPPFHRLLPVPGRAHGGLPAH